MADVSKLYQQAEDAAKRKSYDLAVELYQQILVLDSDAEKARFALREVELCKLRDFGPPSRFAASLALLPGSVKTALYRMAKKTDLSIIEYERMLARNPRNAKVTFQLGRALEAMNQFKSAFAVYRGFLLWDPQNIDANMAAGTAARNLGRLKESLEYFDAARKLNPRDKVATDAYRDVSAMMSLKPREDVASFRDLVKAAPSSAPGKPAEKETSAKTRPGLQNLKAGFEKTPGDAEAALAFGKALVDSGKPGEAVAVVRRSLEAGPATKEDEIHLREAEVAFLDARPAGSAGNAEAVRGEASAARIRLLKARLERDPTRYDCRFDLGILLFEAGELEEAISSFQQAKKDTKKSRDAAFWLGRAFLGKGKFNLAVNQLESALDATSNLLDPKAKETLYYLGKAKQAAGDIAGARKHFERIYEEDINFRDVAGILEAMGEGGGAPHP
jgi:tetratricopeptide (TPR) repeat protein